MPSTRKTDPKVARHQGRKAAAVRYGNTEEAALADRDLRAALIEQRIREFADAMPPLTDEQRTHLAALLRPAAVTGGR
jgi:hypothetical protein